MNATIIGIAVSAVLAIFASITAPLILAWRTDKMHREDRLADWARQDKVALAAKEAAGAAQASADQANRQHAETDRKLDTIHVLVNSNLTAAMRSELDAVTRELAMMREVIALNSAAGREPAPDTLAALAATEAKLAELAAQLADREHATAQADRQPHGDDPEEDR